MLVILLQVTLVVAQSWCGYPECPARPKCSNSELDLIIALDESCSMNASDFNKQKIFASALASASEQRFNISRFAGIVFGYSTPSYKEPVPRTSKIFHSMSSGADLFTAALPSGFDCGGTPTDEALFWFNEELHRTKFPDRMQIAVLVTDGIPTLCYTTGGSCQGTSAFTQRAADAAIAERFSPMKLPHLGSLMLTVGIGKDLDTRVGRTQRYGDITGKQLLENFASSPRMALLAADFDVLINRTLQEVLDLLCFFVIAITEPQTSRCYLGGTAFVIRGYNIFSMGLPMCRWQEIGTNNYTYTNATITLTNETFADEPGAIGLVHCLAPVVTRPLYAYLEVSREGTYYTSNQYAVLISDDCSVSCPHDEMNTLFGACTMADFQTGCSSSCASAVSSLRVAFSFNDEYFNPQRITECIVKHPFPKFTLEDRNFIGAKLSERKLCPTGFTSGVSGIVFSLCLYVCPFLLL